MPQRAPIAVGIVGTGFAASAHAEALRRVRGGELAAVAGSSREKAERAAAAFGARSAFADWRALIADPNVEVVHDCTPNDLHAEVNAAALAAGKHLLSEKPLALDSRETARLAADASRTDVVTGVCFNYRHYPLVRQLKSMLDAAEEPRPHLVRGSYLQDWLVEQGDWNWRVDPARGGSSRAVGDIGSHWLDLAQYVTGDRITGVLAHLGRLHPERARASADVETFAASDTAEHDLVAVETEDFANVLLRFESGCQGVLAVSQVSPGRKNRLLLEIDTARSGFAWDQETPNALWVGRRSEANSDLVRDPALLAPEAARLTHYPGGHQEGWPDALKNLFIDFYAAVAARRDGGEVTQSFASFSDAHRTMLLVEAVLASDASGGWQSVAP
ncbi:MAG: Gfo/Idh/MocA family oxidoreductase [Actinobacteria bacterium]|nr:Gfo/Idh/MocA family oxidoreductase [Actinomycetota bacterium]